MAEKIDKKVDIFEKCYGYKKPSEFKKMGLYPYFKEFMGVESENSPYVIMDGEKVLMFGSNNYLGLTVDPRVKEAAIDAIKKYGTGNSGSRMLNGTLDMHIALENELAEFVEKEATLIFSTGFMTNGSLSSLITRKEYGILDKNVHASIVNGTYSSFGEIKRFRHNNMDDLENILSKLKAEPKIVVVDGVFSMEGDIAPVDKLAELCEKYNSRLYVDEAHGLGVLGKKGVGASEYYGALDKVDIIMGTFSKSFASTGGFIASSKDVIEYVKHTSMPFIYSASMPAPSVAAARKALEIIKKEPERKENLLKVSDLIRKELKRANFKVYDGVTPIIPVVIEDEVVLCKYFMDLLEEEKIYTNPIFMPAAENNMIRISCMAIHTEEHAAKLVDSMVKLGKKYNLI